MKAFRTTLLFLTALIFLAGCAPASSSGAKGSESTMTVKIENPYPPQDGDDKLTRSEPMIDSVRWDAQASTLTISGNTATPCEELRITSSQSGNELSFEVYTLSQPDMLCAQVLQPFEAVLKLENFSADTFTVKVNGESISL